MEFGKTSKMNLTKCFYYPNQTHVFNSKRLLVALLGILAIGSNVLYVFRVAHDAMEYVISAFFIVTAIGIFVSFIDTSMKTAKIYSLIDFGVKIVRKSKH